MHSDSKKRRSFVALLFAAGDLQRWAVQRKERKGGRPVDTRIYKEQARRTMPYDSKEERNRR